MKTIDLGGGQHAIVDDEDLEMLSKYRWRFHRNSPRSGYAVWCSKRDGQFFRIFMHKLIMGAGRGQHVDHINRNSLDNRKSNLRLCSPSENNRNAVIKRARVHPGPRGVTWHKSRRKWRARIRLHGREIALGYFDDKALAAQAYNEAAKTLHGEFAVLNPIGETCEAV